MTPSKLNHPGTREKSLHTYAFTLKSGKRVAGTVLGCDGQVLGAGQAGAIRCDLVHAELGLSLVNLFEPKPGHALVVSPGCRQVTFPLTAVVEVSPA